MRQFRHPPQVLQEKRIAYLARPAKVAGVPRRAAWIAVLRRGENPFTQEELDRLMLQ